MISQNSKGLKVKRYIPLYDSTMLILILKEISIHRTYCTVFKTRPT